MEQQKQPIVSRVCDDSRAERIKYANNKVIRSDNLSSIMLCIMIDLTISCVYLKHHFTKSSMNVKLT